MEDDPYHVGREDHNSRFEVRWMTRRIRKNMRLEGGYRYTTRESTSPWVGGEGGEGIDEDKNYVDNRFWIGWEYSF